MTHLIHVRPARERLRAFAQWATALTPKLRTVSPDTFAVPADRFTQAPEEILIGSTVDGHPYVSPDEEEAAPAVVLPEREAVPGEPLPELPEEAYGPDAVPLDPPDFAPLDDAPADEEAPGAPFTCEDCQRPYATERGMATHRRQKHGKGA